MFTERDPKTKTMGFGNTKEEALKELILNTVRSDIKYDATGEYEKRRQELYSWLPLPTLLTIKSVCGISYNSLTSKLSNTVTGKSIKITPRPLCHYLYLFYLLDGKVSFEDFTITIGKEVNIFMNNISTSIGNLDDFPYTKPGNMSEAVSIHYLKCGGFVSETANNSIIVCNGERILSIDLIDGVDKECMIAYGLAKLGIIYNSAECRRL
jgi:hypothetical protein